MNSRVICPLCFSSVYVFVRARMGSLCANIPVLLGSQRLAASSGSQNGVGIP